MRSSCGLCLNLQHESRQKERLDTGETSLKYHDSNLHEPQALLPIPLPSEMQNARKQLATIGHTHRYTGLYVVSADW